MRRIRETKSGEGRGAAIRADNLSKSYGQEKQRITAVRDVSLAIEAGGITTLMGPSGSGKSTLLAMLSGLLCPDRGSVTLLDRRLDTLTDARREEFRRKNCGFVFQRYNLFQAFSALQQVEIALERASDVLARSIAAVARQMLTGLGLGDRLHLRPQQLYGGEKQRVAVARALAKRPRRSFFGTAVDVTAADRWICVTCGGKSSSALVLIRAFDADSGALKVPVLPCASAHLSVGLRVVEVERSTAPACTAATCRPSPTP